MENIDDQYVPLGKFSPNVVGENTKIGYVAINSVYNNAWWNWGVDLEGVPELKETVENMKKYESTIGSESIVVPLLQLFEGATDLSYKLLLLICLPMMIYGFIKFIIHKDNKSYYMALVKC